jgi:hypothetical protein
MGERSDQITRKIAQTRGELGANLNELELKVRDVTDWRKQVQKSPLTMIGIAFGGGVLLSRVLGGSPRGRRHYRPVDARANGEAASSANAPGTNYELNKAADTWDHIKAALIGVAAGKVQDFLRDAVPGFHEEFSKVEHHNGPESSREQTWRTREAPSQGRP